jgi:hypothetical protein
MRAPVSKGGYLMRGENSAYSSLFQTHDICECGSLTGKMIPGAGFIG